MLYLLLQVQEAVSNCLPHLITSPVLREESTVIVNKLMQKLLKAEKYGERKGAAYGLAGVVKGLGILALKQLDIMTRLTDAIQDKKNYKHREGRYIDSCIEILNMTKSFSQIKFHNCQCISKFTKYDFVHEKFV